MDEASFLNGNERPIERNTFADLLGEKSVQATFRLRPEVIACCRIGSTVDSCRGKILSGVLALLIHGIGVVANPAAVQAAAGFVLGVGLTDHLVHFDHRVDTLGHA